MVDEKEGDMGVGEVCRRDLTGGAEERPVLETRNLTLCYGDRPVFQDITLSIPPAGITAIMGPSGCGKSSFLMCLNRMIEFEASARVSGKVFFEGREKVAGRDLRRSIATVFQKPTPFPFSILKNFQLPLEEAGLRRDEWRERMKEVLLAVGLWDEVHDRLHEPATRLSGGQQQRLCIARALSLRPRVILMDEPCSALDPIASSVVEDLIVDLGHRFPVVVVTHNLAQAKRLASKVAFFWWCRGAGCLMEAGECREVFETPSFAETREYIARERL